MNAAYRVVIQHTVSYDWFYVVVYCDDKVIAKKSCVHNHRRAGKWAAKQIRRHVHARNTVTKAGGSLT